MKLQKGKWARSGQTGILAGRTLRKKISAPPYRTWSHNNYPNKRMMQARQTGRTWFYNNNKKRLTVSLQIASFKYWRCNNNLLIIYYYKRYEGIGWIVFYQFTRFIFNIDILLLFYCIFIYFPHLVHVILFNVIFYYQNFGLYYCIVFVDNRKYLKYILFKNTENQPFIVEKRNRWKHCCFQLIVLLSSFVLE